MLSMVIFRLSIHKQYLFYLLSIFQTKFYVSKFIIIIFYKDYLLLLIYNLLKDILIVYDSQINLYLNKKIPNASSNIAVFGLQKSCKNTKYRYKNN